MTRVLAVLPLVLLACAGPSAPHGSATPASPSVGPPRAASLDTSSEAAFTRSMRERMIAAGARDAVVGDEPLVLRVTAPNGHDLQVNLHNVWTACHRDADACEPSAAELVSAAVTQPAETGGRDTLVPLVRVRAYVDHTRRDLPTLWTEPFVGDLLVVYAFDAPDRYRLASMSDLTRLGLTPAEGAALARANLEARVGRIDQRLAAYTPGEAMVFKEGNGLESSLLLQQDHWATLASRASCRFAAAAPEPDALVVLCVTSDDELARFRQAAQAIANSVSNPLTAETLVWSNGRWAM